MKMIYRLKDYDIYIYFTEDLYSIVYPLAELEFESIGLSEGTDRTEGIASIEIRMLLEMAGCLDADR